jgi:hypothetical protein
MLSKYSIYKLKYIVLYVCLLFYIGIKFGVSQEEKGNDEKAIWA